MIDFRITSLEAKYVGPFEHLSIEFKEKPEAQKDEAEVHIFTGENGTGKSTILYLLAAYPNRHEIRTRISKDNIEHFRVTTVYNDHPITFRSNRENATFFEGLDNKEIWSQYFANVVGLDLKQSKDSSQGFYIFSDENTIEKYKFAMFAYAGSRKIGNPTLKAIEEIKTEALKDSLNFDKSTNAQLLLDWIANTKAREALSIASGKGEQAIEYIFPIVKLQRVISEIIGADVRFELKSKPFNVFVILNGQQLTFEVLPDGLKSIISWLGDLLMRLDRLEWETEMDIFDRNFILFLDEIDIHLHPAWQRKILPVVKKLFKNAQIFISTHSPFVVGSVDGAWVYRLKKEGQYSVLDGDPVLSEDAKSYRLILEEIFGIKEQFGENVEKKLAEFYNLRKEILENKRPFEDETFQNLMKELSPQSIELENILAMELRQLERIQKSKQLQSAL